MSYMSLKKKYTGKLQAQASTGIFIKFKTRGPVYTSNLRRVVYAIQTIDNKTVYLMVNYCLNF